MVVNELVNKLISAVSDANVSISINLTATFPMVLVILGILVILGAFHLRKKVNEKRTEDKQAQSVATTKENTAHLQLSTVDGAICPKLPTKDKSVTNH